MTVLSIENRPNNEDECRQTVSHAGGLFGSTFVLLRTVIREWINSNVASLGYDPPACDERKCRLLDTEYQPSENTTCLKTLRRQRTPKPAKGDREVYFFASLGLPQGIVKD